MPFHFDEQETNALTLQAKLAGEGMDTVNFKLFKT